MGYFTDEHDLFRKSVREFALREIAPHAEEWERTGSFPRDLFRKAGEQGFLSIRFPQEYGGQGLDYWYTVVLCEELVRGVLGVAVDLMVHTELATSAIAKHGTPEQKRRYLPKIVKGEELFALGITEPGHGSNVAGVQTTAKREGDAFVVNGSKTFISNGSRADFITLAVRTGGPGKRGVSLLIFPAKTEGFTVGRKLQKMGAKSSDTVELSFDNCRVPAENLVGEEGKGFYYIMDLFQGERLVLASLANGLMTLCYEEALKYARQREVFGQPIIGYQLWRHRLADLLTTIEASKQLTYHACDILCRTGHAQREISMAKLFSCEAAKRVAAEALQIHGGYGFMEEYPVARLYRDTSALSVGAGTSEIMREIIAAEEGMAGG